MKTFFYFLLTALAWIAVFLSIDLEANLLKISLASAVAAIICLLIFRLVRKPVRKWYMRNFNKTYMMSRGYINGKKIK